MRVCHDLCVCVSQRVGCIQRVAVLGGLYMPERDDEDGGYKCIGIYVLMYKC